MPGVLQTPDAAIAVFEREPYWAPELQRQLGDRVYVRPCTQLADVDAVERDWPRCLAVIDLQAAPTAVLTWCAQRLHRHRSTPVLLFGSPSTADLEWTVRELGATSFRRDLISGRGLAAHCRRLLHR